LPKALGEDKALEWKRNVGSRAEGIHLEILFVLEEGLDSSFLST
jgi:hypothetical protein